MTTSKSNTGNTAKGNFNTKPASKEAKPAKSADVKAAEAARLKAAKKADKGGGVVLLDYSEKALCATGDTKPLKDVLSSLSGRFNKFLSNKHGKFAGWIFSKKHAAELKKALKVTKIDDRDSYIPEAKEA